MIHVLICLIGLLRIYAMYKSRTKNGGIIQDWVVSRIMSLETLIILSFVLLRENS